MSWFKRGGEQKSAASGESSHSDADQYTTLEVFQNHWKQAWTVMSCQNKKTTTLSGQATTDGVEVVLHNMEQMVSLLVNENVDAGLPGPILNYILEVEILEKFCAWCTINISAHERLRLKQLRLFELLITLSKQLLLIHKPVIKPLLRMLIDVADSQEISNPDVEFRLVLVLHQICICISQQSLILERFFSSDTDHGPARFLIFSLLIPFVHREGSVGQKARDALLLIVALSARHPHIGQYIANNSDFCPVLATGLSGLYSSLPRRIIPPSSEWHAITHDDCLRIPDLQMFLNSLQFSNAVVQVAHPLVRDQLIKFIYSGFLLPVLAPALHQVSREEVMTATAYLDLFIRQVTDPHLLRAVLKFVLTERFEDVLILDTLLSRISSNSLLSMVTLALFHTLVNLNCEDVMFQLVFRYLVPCTHVMVSQRRSVRDLDLYSKSAEKFLSLRPSCCTHNLSQNSPSPPSPVPPPHFVPIGKLTPPRRFSVRSISSISSSAPSVVTVSLAADASHNQGESSYFEYLHDAHSKLEQMTKACHHWSYLYDGETPAPDSITAVDKKTATEKFADRTSQSLTLDTNLESTTLLKTSNTDSSHSKSQLESENNCKEYNENKITFYLQTDKTRNNSLFLKREHCIYGYQEECKKMVDPKLLASLSDLNSFLEYLNEFDLPGDDKNRCLNQTVDEDIENFDKLLITIAAGDSERFNSVNAAKEDAGTKSLSLETRGLDIKAANLFDLSKVSAVSPVPTTASNELISCKEPSASLKNNLNPLFSLKLSSDMLSPFKSVLSPADAFHNKVPSSPGMKKLNFLNDPPNIGPFLSALFARLEGMIGNSLYYNLLLTEVLSRLAAYPQPLLRSFLFNHNLVFQPSVKSLIQVLSSLRQKLDTLSLTVKHFDSLVASTRQSLLQREEQLLQIMKQGIVGNQVSNGQSLKSLKTRADTFTAGKRFKERRKVSLTSLIFRRSPGKEKIADQKQNEIQEATDVYSNSDISSISSTSSRDDNNPSLSTWNAVYCALVFDEFLKELAALSQEHSVLF